MSVNPKIFEVIEGKLYLFYNFLGANTLKIWQKEDPKSLQQKADENWKKSSKIKCNKNYFSNSVFINLSQKVKYNP